MVGSMHGQPARTRLPLVIATLPQRVSRLSIYRLHAVILYFGHRRIMESLLSPQRRGPEHFTKEPCRLEKPEHPTILRQIAERLSPAPGTMGADHPPTILRNSRQWSAVRPVRLEILKWTGSISSNSNVCSKNRIRNGKNFNSSRTGSING